MPEVCTDFYTITSGYRKIPGDSCEGGDNYIPIRVMCPHKWGLFSIRTLLILCLCLIVGYFTAKFLNEHGFPTIEAIKGIFIKPKKQKGDEDYNYDIGYNDSDSDGENKRNEPQLELDGDNEEYNEFIQGTALKNKQA
jgi:hypothetical protein